MDPIGPDPTMMDQISGQEQTQRSLRISFDNNNKKKNVEQTTTQTRIEYELLSISLLAVENQNRTNNDRPVHTLLGNDIVAVFDLCVLVPRSFVEPSQPKRPQEGRILVYWRHSRTFNEWCRGEKGE